MRVLFCCPAYGSQVRVETMLTVASAVMHMSQNIPGIEIKMFAIDMAEIARVRNLFASMAMEEGHDALIMLDSDMSVPPETFTRLLLSNHEVCGLTYPKRQIDLAKFHELAASGVEFEAARIASLSFISANAFVHRNGDIDIRESYVEMQELPGGCLVIRKGVFEKMWSKIPSIRQAKDVYDVEQTLGLTRLIRCFDNIQNGTMKFSEDISFCKRWTSIGGKIHALFDVPVSHYGHMKFEGSFQANLMARALEVKKTVPSLT